MLFQDQWGYMIYDVCVYCVTSIAIFCLFIFLAGMIKALASHCNWSIVPFEVWHCRGEEEANSLLFYEIINKGLTSIISFYYLQCGNAPLCNTPYTHIHTRVCVTVFCVEIHKNGNAATTKIHFIFYFFSPREETYLLNTRKIDDFGVRVET